MFNATGDLEKRRYRMASKKNNKIRLGIFFPSSQKWIIIVYLI